MKSILLITTGGTIASRDYGNGLSPGINSRALLEFVPEIEDLCHFETIDLMNLDSTNVGPSQWNKIVSCVENHYDDYDGFVITHGTDTLSYTAAALSYMIQDSPKPVVLTGAQKSIYLRDTDARRNLVDAFIYAADNKSSGIKIVFNSKVIRGTRARKIRTQSYNAFDSIDYPDVGRVMSGKVTHYIWETKLSGPHFTYDMDSSVFVLKLIPGLSPEVIKALSPIYQILIIEAFGTGGLPNHDDFSMRDAIETFTAAGGMVIMATQVPHEGSNLTTYEVGASLSKNPNIWECGNMTLESLVCKLMWILHQTKNPKEVRRLCRTPIDFDLL
ncbi:asparaginase [Eubacteriales bacterium KG127]